MGRSEKMPHRLELEPNSPFAVNSSIRRGSDRGVSAARPGYYFISARIASTNWPVEALPPRSPVRHFAFGEDALDRAFDLVGGFLFFEIAEHEDRAEDQRRRVGEAFAGDVGRGAVDGFEHGRVVADVGARREAEAADQAAGEIGDDVAEQVFHDHHVERIRIHHELHAGGVDDAVVERDIGKARATRWQVRRKRPSLSLRMFAL